MRRVTEQCTLSTLGSGKIMGLNVGRRFTLPGYVFSWTIFPFALRNDQFNFIFFHFFKQRRRSATLLH